ncbi:MAG: succinyl-diaminopimelate desuccinylase [Proteobacteria bacterium]|nr:succinyl-diaminopimelate desuccinylase [Pseudomonadota bacterium]
MSELLNLTQQLIQTASVTPNDAQCQDILMARLEKLGFEIKRISSGPVANFWAKLGNTSPLFVFAGHTDVVPTGPLTQWHSDPFQPTVRDHILYGRGAADMKSSLAAMVIACERFLKDSKNFKGSIGFLITSGEEGDHFLDGTPKVLDYLKHQNEKIDYCLVGEPSCHKQLGDCIRIGRRGSLTGKLRVLGKQGHVAYPQLADNPIHRIAPLLLSLTQKVWDSGSKHFPPTSFQISNIHSGTGATNVIPGIIECDFNFRYSNLWDYEKLQKAFVDMLNTHQLNYEIDWILSGEPFLTDHGKLIQATQSAIQNLTTFNPELSTGGGTSDARFIAKTGCEVIEFGPINASIHQVNEHVSLKDLEQLEKIYYQILNNLLT